MRVYELAKQLHLDSKELVEKLKELKFPVKNHMSAVDKETAELIKQELASLEEKKIQENILEVDFPITVKDFSVKLGTKPSILLQMMLKKGKMFNINQNIDEKFAGDIAKEFGFSLQKKILIEETILSQKTNDTGQLVPRPPVVTLMGHIDHGKTSVLDYIRKTKVAERESGGITQHIGAYQVAHANGKITFLDTPGHETFTAMRSRGAQVTDIVIIIVAADEGVKPQTVEAIDHARQAGVCIMVAINKIDKPNANIDLVKQQLSKLDLAPEEWGGKTITVSVSAKTGQGISELLDMVLLEASMLELKADPVRSALGIVIEARLSAGKGPLVVGLVQQGTLKLGDIVVCGDSYGKVRALVSDLGQRTEQAGPSTPVEILGIADVPESGDKFFVVPSEKEALEIVERRKKKPGVSLEKNHMKLEDLYNQMKAGDVKQLKLIIKSDVFGTLEAIDTTLAKIQIEEIKIEIIHKGVGDINTSDVLLADASDAIVVGFKVGLDAKVKDLAKEKNIQIQRYEIIYELFNDIKAAVEGMLKPTIKRVFMGRAQVRKVFTLSKAGIIAGCMVEKGKISRSCFADVSREGSVIFQGKIQSLKRFKDDVREVAQGFECGISVGLDSIQEGDIIDVFTEETVARRISS